MKPMGIMWPRLTRYISVWPTPKQAAFLLLPQLEALYGGAAGGGKSVALLAAALQFVDVPGYSALIVRKSYTSLTQPGGLIDVSKQWLTGTDARWIEDEHTWRFPSGAKLAFRHLQGELHLQGAEYQFIGVDEVTDLTLEESLYLFTRLRRVTALPTPLRMRLASNPHGPGHDWVRQRFMIEGEEAGRIFIPARLEDNPFLDPSYELALQQLPELMYRRYRLGDWEVRLEGGLFVRGWFEGRFIDQYRLPPDLRLCRFWDLAATEARPGTDPDYTVGLLLGRDLHGVFYVIDVIRVRRTAGEVERLVRETAEADRQRSWQRSWPAPMIRMEEEPGSAGIAIVSSYRRQVLPAYDFKGVRASGSKELRAIPVAGRIEAGDVLIVEGSWNSAFIDELSSFPHGRHDDQVDAFSGAFAALVDVTEGRARIHRVRIR
jgi:predicted phage terminase large subunit-like protein